jgi:hypothetical protein
MPVDRCHHPEMACARRLGGRHPDDDTRWQQCSTPGAERQGRVPSPEGFKERIVGL